MLTPARTSPRLAQLALAALIFGIAITSLTAQEQVQASRTGGPPNARSIPAAYDVVSVKPHKSDATDRYSGWQYTPSGITGIGVSARSLIMTAYHLIMPDQISNLPSWVDTDNFDLEAKLDPDNAEALARMPDEEREVQRQIMLRSLLADRFKLKASHSMKELPVYSLVIAKGGPKLKGASSQNAGYNVSMNALCTLKSDSIDISELAAALSNFAGRLILDRTRLAGKYRVSLNWAFNEQVSDAGPSLVTALQDQLGLKLEPAKAPVDVIVIDHLERPSEN